MNENYQNIFTSKFSDCLFPEQFSNWDDSYWNTGKYSKFYKRLNKIEDDRSYVILAMNLLEGQIDIFLEHFVPEPQILFSDRTNLVSKIKVIQAFKLLPPQFFEMLDLLRKIRNFFAHNLEIDSFEEGMESPKLKLHIHSMHEIWKKYERDMTYWNEDKPIRFLYKDLWNKCFRGLHVFERNVKLFRKETENPEFIKSLQSKSIDMEKKLRASRAIDLDSLSLKK